VIVKAGNSNNSNTAFIMLLSYRIREQFTLEKRWTKHDLNAKHSCVVRWSPITAVIFKALFFVSFRYVLQNIIKQSSLTLKHYAYVLWYYASLFCFFKLKLNKKKERNVLIVKTELFWYDCMDDYAAYKQ